jgi:L-asparaginase
LLRELLIQNKKTQIAGHSMKAKSTASISKVAVIGTGGTIAGEASDITRSFSYADSQHTIASLVETLPKTMRLPPLECEQLFQTGSEDFTETHWLTLAHRVQIQVDRLDIAGVVITQGTDTIEETAYFLHLLLNTDKPVVVVGAMRPAGAAGSDMPLNLYHAIVLARHAGARGMGVLVMMNDRIHCARDVTKTNTWTLDSFQSPEFGPLGYMLDDEPVLMRRPVREHTNATPFALPLAGLPRVDLIVSHVAIRADVIDASVRAGARGIVFAGTGNGSIPGPLKAVLREAVLSGCTVVRASRVASGFVVRNAAEDDDGLGFVAADTLPALKARVLLQLALATDKEMNMQSLFGRF